MARKKKKGKSSNQPQKLTTYIKQAARKLPILECRALSGWSETGMTHIVIARQKPNNEILVGHYMMDTFCLGLKNTSYQMISDQYEYEDYIEMLLSQNDFEIIDKNLAFNLIYGAIEYAEDLGFEPHKDFALTEYILTDVDEVEYIDIEFGQNGKPHFFSGPYDNIEKVINTLEKNVGKGNYHFTAHLNGGTDFREFDEEIDDKIDAFFPEERINIKRDSIEDEEDKYTFETYLSAAEVLLELSEGDIDVLEEDWEDDVFFGDAVKELKTRLITQDLNISEEEQNAIEKYLERNMIFVAEKLIEHKNIEFLLEEDFNPTPKLILDGEYAQMTNEEARKQEEKIFKSMTREEKNQYVFERYFVQEMFSDDEKNISIPKLDEDSDEYYNKLFTKLNTTLTSGTGGEGLLDEKEEVRVYFQQALKMYWEMTS